MNNANPHRPAWLTLPCPLWCEFPDDHGDCNRYADRAHHGPEGTVTLTADEPPMTHHSSEGLIIHDHPSRIGVYLTQHYREVEPRVYLGRDGDTGTHLTLDEAERLAHLLLDRVTTARKAHVDDPHKTVTGP